MIEVFKTNLQNRVVADLIIKKIRYHFGYLANFDLQDCDNILRIDCKKGIVQSALLIEFLKRWDCIAEILHDNVPSVFDETTIVNSVS